VSVTPVILPKLGLTMDEGRLVAWLKKEGDHVDAGEVLFEVETDKATMEVESPVAGYVRRLLAAGGDDIPVTAVIALITTTADEPIADEPPSAASKKQDGSPAVELPIPRWLFSLIGHVIAASVGLGLGYGILHWLQPKNFPWPW
jgi:pyruvate/2-oxoglutarate dehydrogenase complex dihydrolipoamide acyltransferase (E2) component